MSWQTKLNNRLSNSTVLNDLKEEFEEYLDNAINTFNVTINYLPTTIEMVIQNSSALDKTSDTMIGLTSLTYEVMVGDIVTWENQDWIVVNRDDKVIKNCNKVSFQKSNNSLKFYSPTSTLLSIPCIVTNRILLNSAESSYMTLPEKTINVIAPNTEDTLQIKEGQRFILGTNAYKVDAIDDISVVGLLNIRMSWTETNANDDMVNKIAWNSDVSDSGGGGW